MSLSDLIAPVLHTAADRVAVIGCGRRLTYRDLDDRARGLAAHWLGSELKPCDRVALLMRNSPEVLVAYLACWKAGLIAVPIDLRYQPQQSRFILNNSEARAIVVDAEKQGDLAAADSLPHLGQIIVANGPATLPGAVTFENLTTPPVPEPRWPRFVGDQLSTIFYTSGTTSRPKGVVHSGQRTHRRVAKMVRECRLGPDSVSLVCLSLMRPLAFQTQALAVLSVGGCVVTLPRFAAEAFWQTYNEPPAKTLLAFTPDMLAAILNHPAALSADYTRLELCIAGGDSVPPTLHTLFREVTGKELVEMCGMTETGPYAMNPPYGIKKVGSIGQALEGVLLRIVDAEGEDVPVGQLGQILVRTPDVMFSYWNDSLRTFEVIRDGWLYTGDLGHCDADDYVWFHGRLKDMIVRDGKNVSPIEVEEALQSHPAVEEAVVVGVDDPPHGQAVEAFVRWRQGLSESPTVEQVRSHVAGRIEAVAMPRAIYVVDNWPRTGQGKIDRQRLQWIGAAGGVGI
jgi:acyl-CoA synthetase (AMP-forming)/AMP-acid ligase II